jgi:hypothetical protein
MRIAVARGLAVLIFSFKSKQSTSSQNQGREIHNHPACFGETPRLKYSIHSNIPIYGIDIAQVQTLAELGGGLGANKTLLTYDALS